MTPLLVVAFMALQTPPPLLEDGLDYFIGQWSCEGHSVPANRPIAADVTFTRDVVTRAMTMSHRDRPPHIFSANQVWGRANLAEGLRAVIHDPYSGLRWYTSPGWVGGRLSWDRVRTANEPEERFVYVREGEDAWTVEWWISRNGEPAVLGDTSLCARVSSASGSSVH